MPRAEAQGELEKSVVPPEFPPGGTLCPVTAGTGGALPPRGLGAPSLPVPGRACTKSPSLFTGMGDALPLRCLLYEEHCIMF